MIPKSSTFLKLLKNLLVNILRFFVHYYLHLISTFDISESVTGGIPYDPVLFQKKREELLKYMPSSQDEIPARRMTDSYDEAIIPLSTDTVLSDKYRTHVGGVRVGRLLEDMGEFTNFRTQIS